LSDVEFSFYFPLNAAITGRVLLDQGFKYFLNSTLKAEKLGFKVAFLPDHFMLPNNNALLEAWTALTAFAASTHRILLSSLVTPLPFYNPVILAKRVATLDIISDGRAVFGAGCGWYEREFKAYGIPFDRFEIRVQKMMEGIEVIKALWTMDNPVTYKGRYYHLEAAEFLPKPIQKPHPPIWFGGSSRRILEATAKHGQGWIPYEIPLRTFKEKLSLLRKLIRRAKRDPADVTPAISFRTVISTDSEEVKKQMKRLSMRQRYVHPIIGVEGRTICGTPKECVDEIRKYVKAGARHIAVGIQPTDKTLEGLELYSEEVIPAL
jgi:probable F420-dependent oxidoreductase